jgi:hypothetical protein
VNKEVARIASLTPLHYCNDEKPDEVIGYHWPTNIHFVINSSETQSDAKSWDKPENFDPECFINPSNINNPKAH